MHGPVAVCTPPSDDLREMGPAWSLSASYSGYLQDEGTSMAQGTQAIEKFEDAAVSSAKNVGSAFSQTAAPVTAATHKIDAATRRYIASVERDDISNTVTEHGGSAAQRREDEYQRT